jgi:hypothetical protein
LRQEYLCDFAALYHFPAQTVDAFRYMDFLQYVLGIQAERKHRAQQQEG